MVRDVTELEQGFWDGVFLFCIYNFVINKLFLWHHIQRIVGAVLYIGD
jgi:hypothetical protein